MVALGLWEGPGRYIFWPRTGHRKTTTKRIEICVVHRRRLHYDAASIRSACRPAQLQTDKQHGVAWLLLRCSPANNHARCSSRRRRRLRDVTDDVTCAGVACRRRDALVRYDSRRIGLTLVVTLRIRSITTV